MAQRQSAAIIKPKTVNKNRPIASPGKGGESDIQSYYIIRFKCPVLNQKVTVYKKKHDIAHSNGKINQQKLS